MLVTACVLIVGTSFGANAADASTTVCVHLENLKVCRSPVPGGTRVCTTFYNEGISVEKCRVEHPRPKPRRRPAHHKTSYYLTRREAQRDIVSHFRDELGYSNASASCVLPEGAKPQRGYAYHLWLCGIAA
jgi:hypothetical protein